MTNGGRMCGTKKRHASMDEAMEELGHLTGMHIYLCPHCGHYHIGHIKRRRGVET